MKLGALFALVVSFASAAPVTLIYSRTFRGSSPEYFRVSLGENGALAYTEQLADDQPLQAHLAAADTGALFAMAKQLQFFKSPLESGLKVANTGKKILRYEDGGGASFEQTFNYSTDPIAQRLVDRFEQIAASERAYLDLDRTIHFDKLGVNDSLATVESLYLRKQLAAPDQFLPLLTRVATHDSFMHLARDRAARLRDEFAKSSSASDVKER